jgi:hypothetical protein
VILRSGRRTFDAEAVDLSRMGVLVRLPNSAVSRAIGGRRRGTALDAVQRHFGGVFEVEFVPNRVVRRAHLVRMVLEVVEPHCLRLGCEFATPLDEAVVQALAEHSQTRE